MSINTVLPIWAVMMFIMMGNCIALCSLELLTDKLRKKTAIKQILIHLSITFTGGTVAIVAITLLLTHDLLLEIKNGKKFNHV